MTEVFCLFCHRRPRAPEKNGLCLVCHATPLVVQRVAIRPAGRQEVRRLPPPTTHLPGTAGKVDVLEWRAQNGFQLWHPHDRRTAPDRPQPPEVPNAPIPDRDSQPLPADETDDEPLALADSPAGG